MTLQDDDITFFDSTLTRNGHQKPEPVFAADLVKPLTQPSTKWWRRALRTASGGLIDLGESADERLVRALRTAARRHLSDIYVIGIVGGGGGVGKTTATTIIGSIFARTRTDKVAALDLDPANGSLATRIDPSVSHTSREIAASTDITRYSHVRRFTGENESGLEVAASPRRGETLGEALSAQEFTDTYAKFAQFYGLILVDCGNDLAHPVMPSVLGLTNALVMVTSPDPIRIDGTDKNLRWLDGNGYKDLLGRTILLINHVRSACDRGDRKTTDQLVASIRENFAGWVGKERILTWPFDPHIVRGGDIKWDRLRPGIKRRALETAAVLADGFTAI
jgi:MinD-like ATPase involved in chromosome partitioning or flagellar assembly